ncbi:MAG: hypothetical protein K0Q72_207 [Armatimonadetes bacterium]|jgi:hypothetical protein|nr:hypothetical protein [Armatimonadota bacterium]
MLDFAAIKQLLQQQAKAYQLLLWLGDQATETPQLLGREAVRQLREPDSALAWLRNRQTELPADLLPQPVEPEFAALLASFLSTSFQIQHLEFEGRLVEARLTRGAAPDAQGHVGLTQCLVLAVRHLAASQNLPISGKEAGLLVNRKSLRQDAVLWAYLWELERRACNKGKGSVVHRIWSCIPKETRKSLTAERVWAAREALLTAVRELYTPESGNNEPGSGGHRGERRGNKLPKEEPQ